MIPCRCDACERDERPPGCSCDGAFVCPDCRLDDDTAAAEAASESRAEAAGERELDRLERRA